MISTYEFESERLGFRRWTEEDKIPFAQMNADKDVMEFFPKLLTKTESDAFVGRIEAHFENFGYALWAIDVKATNEFIGYIGFYSADSDLDFTPCVEIGWRISKKNWHKGYATEGAKACLKYGLDVLNLDEIYSFTSKINVKSINVMEKIGLVKEREFDHPDIGQESPLKAHVLYKLDINTFKAQKEIINEIRSD